MPSDPQDTTEWEALPGWSLGSAPTSRGYYHTGQRMLVGDLIEVLGNTCHCIYRPHNTFRIVDLVHTTHGHLSEQWIAAAIFADNHPGGGMRHYVHPADIRLLEPAS